MENVPEPSAEEARLAALRAYEVLDTAPEEAFDDIVRLAAFICDVPIALVSLVDDERQWFKARIGLEPTETARDIAFCAHTILGKEPFVVTDAAADARFTANPLVTGDPRIRFYAGAPLVTPEGYVLGSLCAIDVRPRELSPQQLDALEALSAQVVAQLEQRRKTAELAEAVATLEEAQAAQRQAAARLREREERLRLILESSGEGIYGIDLDGLATFVNPAAADLLGFRPEELVGRNMHDLVHHHHEDGAPYPVAECPIYRGLKEGAVCRVDSEVMWRRDGTSFPVEYSSHPIVDGDDTVGAVVTFTDISDRKQVEAALAEAHHQALESSRLKSQFLANMSHEIRTPMNGVIGMTALLLETSLSVEQRDYASTIRRSASALLDIINDILDFSKIEAGKVELETIDFDLRTVVEDVVELLATPAGEKGLEVGMLIQADVETAVRGDAGRLRQILFNLVGNAIKFTDAGDVTVYVRTAQESSDEVVVLFEVTDTGIGIPAEQQARLFLSFAQADASTTRQYGGTGLGLTISKQLVELMGGQIGVRSEVGQGTTFWFTVRLGRSTEPSVKVAIGEGAMTGLRVLVVDDNAVNRLILARGLMADGIRSDTADGADAALALLRAAAAGDNPYDVAILDYHMPGTDGLDLARSIRADAAIATTPLVLLTSSGQKGDALIAREAGIDAFLTKPARHSTLHDCIAAVMGGGASRDVPGPLVTQFTLSEAQAQRRRHLLVADDNVVNQKVAALMLEKLGYRVDVVANGAEALEALGRTAYAAVLMDCQMPEMDGYEATAEIRKLPGARARTPIIAMTAGVMKGDEDKALEAGMDDYLSKPVTLEQLSSIVARWVGAAAGQASLDQSKS